MTPVLNIFLNLIPLLLVTAVFVQTSVINLSLPSNAAVPRQEEKPSEEKTEELLILSIASQGFYLFSEDKLIKIIPKEKNYDFDKYDFDKLEIILKKYIEAFPVQKSIVIESEDNIIYDHIIHTMDRCRACGLVNIILSASKS